MTAKITNVQNSKSESDLTHPSSPSTLNPQPSTFHPPPSTFIGRIRKYHNPKKLTLSA